MARSSIFNTRPESGEPPASRRAGSRAMTTLDFSAAAAPATNAPASPACRRPLRVTPCCGPMRMALAPGGLRYSVSVIAPTIYAGVAWCGCDMDQSRDRQGANATWIRAATVRERMRHLHSEIKALPYGRGSDWCPTTLRGRTHFPALTRRYPGRESSQAFLTRRTAFIIDQGVLTASAFARYPAPNPPAPAPSAAYPGQPPGERRKRPGETSG